MMVASEVVTEKWAAMPSSGPFASLLRLSATPQSPAEDAPAEEGQFPGRRALTSLGLIQLGAFLAICSSLTC